MESLQEMNNRKLVLFQSTPHLPQTEWSLLIA